MGLINNKISNNRAHFTNLSNYRATFTVAFSNGSVASTDINSKINLLSNIRATIGNLATNSTATNYKTGKIMATNTSIVKITSKITMPKKNNEENTSRTK